MDICHVHERRSLYAEAQSPLAAGAANAYTVGMKRSTWSCLFLCAVLLTACGPKDIGTGTSTEYAASGGHISPAEQMRYPMTGASSVQRSLYHYNRPHIMQNMQEWRASQLRQQIQGGQDSDPADPAYRAVPRERSPFRQ